MRRGTTPTITLTVDADISDWTRYVTLKKGNKILTLENDRQEASYANGKTTILVTLTQQETLDFMTGYVDVQVRAIKDGTAIATDIKKLDIGAILKEGVISE